jgi:hypothetical protein
MWEIVIRGIRIRVVYREEMLEIGAFLTFPQTSPSIRSVLSLHNPLEME